MGHLRWGEVVGIETRSQEPIGECAVIAELDPHWLDGLIGEIDAVNSLRLLCRRYRDAHSEFATDFALQTLLIGWKLGLVRLGGGASMSKEARRKEKPEKDFWQV